MKKLWKLYVLGLLSIILFFVLIRLGIFGKLPSFEELENPKFSQASEIFSADSVLIGKFYLDNRTPIAYSELSPHLVHALVSTEDKRFYDHSGIDLIGTIRAIVSFGGDGGGSTITQQLAKNMFHNHASNIIARIMQKFKEWEIAVMLERRYTKDEIIAMYFNSVDFVNNADGIESASRIYFNKKAKDLTIDEAAMFVGMLKNPSRNNPRRFAERAKLQRNVVLNLMQEQGHLTTEQCESYKQKPILLNFRAESASEGIAPYFRSELGEFLKKWAKENKKPDGTNYNIYKDGLRIYTTLDTRMQKHAEAAVLDHLKRYQAIFNSQFVGWHPFQEKKGIKILMTAMKNSDKYKALKEQGLSDSKIETNFKTEKSKMKIFTYKGMRDTTMTSWDSLIHYKKFLQVGFLAMEPYTGYVRAWVGGPNHEFFKYDHVNENTKRQVGSTFKPIVYALAIDNGWSPCMVVTPGNVRIGSWMPKGGGGGPQTLKVGLTKSNNKVAAYIIKNFGVQATVDLAKSLGITSNIPKVPSIALGSCEVSLYEMMTVYSTFPNAGISTKPQFILRIEDKNGNVIQNFTTEMHEVFSDDNAYKMCDLMKGPVGKGGTAASLRSIFKFPGVDVGGKTGTTNKNTDAWFIGYTQDLVAGAWVGCDDPYLRFLYTGSGQGARAAMPIWANFYQKVYSDPKLKMNPKSKFFTPTDSTLKKNPCNMAEEVLIGGGDAANWTDIEEENTDSEFEYK